MKSNRKHIGINQKLCRDVRNEQEIKNKSYRTQQEIKYKFIINI